MLSYIIEKYLRDKWKDINITVEEGYVVDSVRTPIGKRNGSLRDVHPVDLLGDLMHEVARTGNLHDIDLDPEIKRVFVTAHEIEPE